MEISYPPAAWEHDLLGVSIVTDATQPHGDLRRYGCVCDGTTDDSAAFQRALDAAGLVCAPLRRPPLPMLISTPLVLQSRITHQYSIHGDDYKSSGNVITCTASSLFVGAGYADGTFTDITLTLTGIVVVCAPDRDVVALKAINLYGSRIAHCKFYAPYVLIEGSLRWWTRLDDVRVQGFRRAFICTSSTLPGVTRDEAAAAYVTAGYDAAALSGHLVRASGGDTLAAYLTKSNDSFIRGCYLAGAKTNTTLASVLEIDDIDADVIFAGTWIEFVEYVARPYLRTNTVATSATIYGTHFGGCVIQYVYRLLEETTNWGGWVFDGCDMTSFSRSAMSEVFTNVTGARFATKRCGVLVADRPGGDTATYTDIVLTDNRWHSCDHGIYLDAGTASKYHRVRERGTKLLAGQPAVMVPIFVRLRVSATNQTSFTGCWFDLLQHRVHAAQPPLSDAMNYYLNTFNGQQLTVTGMACVSMLGLDMLPKFQALA